MEDLDAPYQSGGLRFVNVVVVLQRATKKVLHTSIVVEDYERYAA
jgi:hypothetical protein